jgi:hypothetical protein
VKLRRDDDLPNGFVALLYQHMHIDRSTLNTIEVNWICFSVLSLFFKSSCVVLCDWISDFEYLFHGDHKHRARGYRDPCSPIPTILLAIFIPTGVTTGVRKCLAKFFKIYQWEFHAFKSFLCPDFKPRINVLRTQVSYAPPLFAA